MSDQSGNPPQGGQGQPPYPPQPPPAAPYPPQQPNYPPQQPNYPQPYQAPPQQYGYPQPYAPPPPNNGYAVASLICSIVGALFFLPVIGPILGIVFGNMANKQIEASQGREGGESLAKGGVIIGWIGLGLNILVIGLFIVFFLGVFAFLSGTAEVFENLPTPSPSP